MKFKVGDLVKDQDGDSIRIVCVDKAGCHPIVGVWYDLVLQYEHDGTGFDCADLIAPAKPKVRYLAFESTIGALFHYKEGSFGHTQTEKSVLDKDIRRPSLDLECEVDE